MAASSEQPKRRERLDTAARREQLIAVGRELFQQRPYDQVSMDDVAAAAGVSKGLIFHYFDSKRDLYVEIIGRGANDLMQASMVSENLPPMERLVAGLHRYLEYAERAGKGYTSLLTGGVGTMAGTLTGVLIFGTIQTVLIFDGRLNSSWLRIAMGLLLLLFILFQRFLSRSAPAAR